MKNFILFALILTGTFLKAQNPNFTWAKKWGGTGDDYPFCITTDVSGNVFTTGWFQGTVDFDPNAGVTNLTSGGGNDIFISKLDGAGNLLWAKKIGNTGSDLGYSISTDVMGNSYITGSFFNTVDFDPNAGVFNLTSSGAEDIFILKLDASGNFVWAKKVGGSGVEDGYSIAIDGLGNVCYSGRFAGTADFDPNAGVSNMTSFSGNFDIFISKLDASGNFIWAKQMGGTLDEWPLSITIDASNNILTTGMFSSAPADFDPSAGSFTLSATGGIQDIFVSKLDLNGNFVWAKQMGGAGSDYGSSLDTDNNGNVYLTGVFAATADFDPGFGTFNLTVNGGSDIFISKLDNNGNFVWAKQIGAAGASSDYGYGIYVDAAGNVYSTGRLDGVADFDPGAGVFNLTPASSIAAYISKLDANGNFVWAGLMDGPSTEEGYSITLDALGSIYVTGWFQGTADFNASAGVFNMTSAGLFDAFVVKYCQSPVQPSAISGSVNICSGASSIYSVSPSLFASSYSWALPSGWSGSNSTNSINATSGSSGVFTITAINSCGTSLQQTLNVIVNPLPTITVNSGSICSGQTFTIVPAGANAYTIQGGSATVSPGSTTSYTVIGTNTLGCVSPSPATSNVTVSATPTVTVNSGSICSGKSFTIIPTGANTYTIQGGSAIVNPTATTSYSVTGTSSAGCVSSSPAVSSVTVNPLPTVNATTSNSIICGPPNPGTVTLTGNGANTYTWNTSATTNTIAVSPSVTTQYTITGTDSNGCVNSSVFTQSVSTCTGFSELLTHNSELTIYPNPTSSVITISGSDGSPVTVYNILGEEIHTELPTATAYYQVDLSQQPNGIYFVKVGTVIKKIIKQ